MSKYLPMNSLSVGYNYGSQGFFDILNEFRDYIHSYYFSFRSSWDGHVFSKQELRAYKNLFRGCRTYGIPGNILLNIPGMDDEWRDVIEEALSFNVYIDSVTCIDPDTAALVKDQYSDLQVHASIRLTDFNQYDTEELKAILSEGIFDVINISGAHHLTDHAFRQWCTSHGIKTKIILNEYCIARHNRNTMITPEDRVCSMTPEGHVCNHGCADLIKKNPWMDLARVYLYKEMIPYLNADIYKLATRSTRVSNEDLKNLLRYWTSDDPTDSIWIGHPVKLTSKKMPAYYEYVKDRMSCNQDCASCMKCKAAYNKLI